jgi:CheY-like chemotaxis protein
MNSNEVAVLRDPIRNWEHRVHLRATCEARACRVIAAADAEVGAAGGARVRAVRGVNEVIGNRARKLLGCTPSTKHAVYPNHHVNMGRRPGEGCCRQAARRRQTAGPLNFPASRNAHRRLPDAGDMTLRCLIVDDNRRFLDAARGLLERQGITVVGEASTSAEALRLAVELQPDVTLLDIDLGGESGCELARRLSRETNTAPSRMILISTHAEQDYADLIAASPAVGFLSKSTLSAGAIRDLLGSQRDCDPGDVGPVPQIFGGDHDAGSTEIHGTGPSQRASGEEIGHGYDGRGPADQSLDSRGRQASLE